MIGYLKGSVLFVKDESLVINAGGVGYNVCCPLPLLARAEGEMELYVTTVVREDAITLYGFETRDDQKVFDKLMSVTGVGAKSALAALSVMSAGEIANAVIAEDVQTLCKIPKVGKKTAQQIILDLKDRLGDVPPDTGDGAADAAIVAEAVMVLTDALGFSRSEARKAVADIVSEGRSRDVSEIVTLALKRLGEGR